MAVAAGLDQAPEGVHVFTELRDRPVDKEEVDVVQPELLQADLDGVLGDVETLVGVGHLGGDEQLRAGNAGGRDGAADRGFVAVDRSGVDQPITDLQRRRHGALGFVVGQFRDAETDHRHRVLVVECNGGDVGARLASHVFHLPVKSKVRGSGPSRFPSSSEEIDAMSLSVSSKSNTSKLLAIRSGFTDLGMTILPS